MMNKDQNKTAAR